LIPEVSQSAADAQNEGEYQYPGLFILWSHLNVSSITWVALPVPGALRDAAPVSPHRCR
jgi:hypothetical protein